MQKRERWVACTAESALTQLFSGKGFTPCSQCGGSIQHIYETDFVITETFQNYKYQIRCRCGATLDGEICLGAGENTFCGIIDDAIDEWNKKNTCDKMTIMEV